ncbi:MAG: YcxB family protein [Ruminococcaceae bacterium]|nr:YcxB family protein [Oscillospiraceae bacterium]
MEFSFETAYNQKAMTAMAKGLRKTVRKKRSRRSHIFGWMVTLLALLLVYRSGQFDFRAAVTLLAALLILLTLIFEDRLNGYFARKKMLPGSEKAVIHFTDESYTSETEIGKTEFYYEKIIALAETGDYFIFLFSSSHAQVYDKRTLSGGSLEEFRTFIEERTRMQISRIS